MSSSNNTSIDNGTTNTPQIQLQGVYYAHPSAPAAYLFCVLFGILVVSHLFQCFRYRTWYMVVLLAAAVMECAGYPTRVTSVNKDDINTAAFVSEVLTIIAPAFVAAQDYMIVGRIMAFVGSENSLIKHTHITKIFVFADIVAILVQGAGSGLIARALNNVSLPQLNQARAVLVAGLSIQLITFGVFLLLAIWFHVKSKNSPALKAYWREMQRMDRLWIAFYVSGALITARSIYRALEFGSTKFIVLNLETMQYESQGYLLTHEWAFYALDAVPIFLAILALNIAHPGMYLPRHKEERIGGGWEPQPGHRRFLCFGSRYPPRLRPETAKSQTYPMTNRFVAPPNVTDEP